MEKDSRVDSIRVQLREMADAEKAVQLQRFFKTGPGEYGEGDRFLGITVPKIRRLTSACARVDLDVAGEFLHSQFHEERLFALLMLAAVYKKAGSDRQERVYEMYLANTECINNWDLVDLSAPHIVGAHLEKKPRGRLYELAVSRNLWERRISIIATFHFIRLNDLADTLEIARMLLSDKEDLIHKAAGWMLREAGKRNAAALKAFLERHASSMPRTMLRYSIEKLPPNERTFWLRQKTTNKG